MKSKFKSIIKYAYPFVVLAALWEVIYLLKLFPEYWFPSVPHLITLFFKMILNGSIISYTFMSVLNTAIGFFCGALLGVVLGMLAGTNRHFKGFVFPIVNVVYPIPCIAWLPLVLLWFGFGYKAIVFTVALGGFFSVFYNTVIGVENINPNYIRAAKNLGLSRLKFAKEILFLGAFPFIFTGLKQAYGRSWRALIAAEMLSFNTRGLGWFIWRANEFFNFDQLIVGLIMISIVSQLIETFVFNKIEEKTLKKWQ